VQNDERTIQKHERSNIHVERARLARRALLGQLAPRVGQTELARLAATVAADASMMRDPIQDDESESDYGVVGGASGGPDANGGPDATGDNVDRGAAMWIDDTVEGAVSFALHDVQYVDGNDEGAAVVAVADDDALPLVYSNDDSGAPLDVVAAQIATSAPAVLLEVLSDEDESDDDDDEEEDPLDRNENEALADHADTVLPDDRDGRRSVMMSRFPQLPPAVVRDASKFANVTIGSNVPISQQLYEAEAANRMLVAFSVKHELTRDAKRDLFKLLQCSALAVASTYEAAEEAAKASVVEYHSAVELRAVQLPILSQYARADHDNSDAATVTYSDPLDLLKYEIMESLRRAKKSNPGARLADAIRQPVAAELERARADYDAFYNHGMPHRDFNQLPEREPASIFEAPAMAECFAHFAQHVAAGDRVVLLSFSHDETALYRRQFGTPIRMRSSILAGEWHELATVDEKKHDINDFYNVVVEPMLLKLSNGVRIRFGDEFVVIVGVLHDVALDKLAAVKFFGLKGKSPALLTSALQESDDFRSAPYQGGVIAVRSLELMAQKYEAALRLASEPGKVGVARELLKAVGMKFWERNNQLGRPFWLSPALALFRRSMRLWPCRLHQSSLGIVMHFLNRIARSVGNVVVTGEFNPRLQSFPKQRFVEHVNGALFEIISSTKGAYFNCKMVTKSGTQRLHAAIQLCAILDELARQHRFEHFRLFADALGIYLRFDQAQRSGDLAAAREIYFEQWLPSLRAAPWRFNADSKRGKAAMAAHAANQQQQLEDLRVNLFVDLPKVADTSIGLFSTPFVGPGAFCDTAGAEKAHQATKTNFARHSSLNMTSGNISSLNIAERRRAAAIGREELHAQVEAARVRARAGGNERFMFVFAKSEAIVLTSAPEVLAVLIGEVEPRARRARRGRLRMRFPDNSSAIISMSTEVCPSFLRVEIAQDPVSSSANDIAGLRGAPFVELLGVYVCCGRLYLHGRLFVAEERLANRPWTHLREITEVALLANDLELATIVYCTRHVLKSVLYFDIFDVD
jgi:hypothetical protein